MKILYLVTLLFLLSNCKSHFDNVPIRIYNEDDRYSYEVKDSETTVINKNKIGIKSDQDSYFPQNYRITVPRKIRTVSGVNSADFITFSKNNLLIIDSGYKRNKKPNTEWKEIKNDKIILEYLKDYYDKYLEDLPKKRDYKLFYDGRTYIGFYNWKDTKEMSVNTVLNSFEYTN